MLALHPVSWQSWHVNSFSQFKAVYEGKRDPDVTKIIKTKYTEQGKDFETRNGDKEPRYSLVWFVLGILQMLVQARLDNQTTNHRINEHHISKTEIEIKNKT